MAVGEPNVVSQVKGYPLATVAETPLPSQIGNETATAVLGEQWIGECIGDVRNC